MLLTQRGIAALRVARVCQRRGVPVYLLRAVSSPPPLTAEEELLDGIATAEANADGSIAVEPLRRVTAELDIDMVHPGFDNEAARRTASAARQLGMRVADYQGDAATLLALSNPKELQRVAEEAGLPVVADPLGAPEGRTCHILAVPVLANGHDQVQVLAEQQQDVRQGNLPAISESPAPFLSFHRDGREIGEALRDGVARFVSALDGIGLLTLYFSVDAAGVTRLQHVARGLVREHSLSDLLYGVDLVDWQIDLLLGGADPRQLGDLPVSRQACSATLLAGLADDKIKSALRGSSATSSGRAGNETTETDAAEADAARTEAGSSEAPVGKTDHHTQPVLGSITHVQADGVYVPPPQPGRLRTEVYLESGKHAPLVDRAGVHFTVTATLRHRALLLLDRALASTSLGQMPSNLSAMMSTLRHESFRVGQYDASTFALERKVEGS